MKNHEIYEIYDKFQFFQIFQFFKLFLIFLIFIFYKMTTQEKLQQEIDDLNEELEEKEDFYKKLLEEKQDKIDELYEKIDELEDKLREKNNEFKTKISNLEYDNKQLNDYIKDLEQQIKYKDGQIKFRDSRFSELENKLSQYENDTKYKELKEQLISKDDVITQLNAEIKTFKQSNKTEVANSELKNKIRLQNQVIKKLKDQVILQDEFERYLDSITEEPKTNTSNNNERKIYKNKTEIKNYQHEYDEIYKQIVTFKDKRYPNSGRKLNITNYKKATDFKKNTNDEKRSMKYLEDLGIERDPNTNVYYMSKTQVDGLIEKIVLYQKNERIHKL